jgi:hypothetical protein
MKQKQLKRKKNAKNNNGKLLQKPRMRNINKRGGIKIEGKKVD